MKALLSECVARLGSGLSAFPFEDPRCYADWLAQTYYYVRHSTRLLAAAAARFSLDAFGDRLHQRFAAHMAEEKRHERLATHDLHALGKDLDQFPERDTTRQFWEPQYYKIEHEDPIALFGYILALEGMSAAHGPAALARAQQAHSPAATKFLEVHAQDDEDHLAKALTMIAGLDEHRGDVVRINMRQSTHGYLAILSDIRRP